jgi:glycosyltransferase involved in cell wall biosynthesis
MRILLFDWYSGGHHALYMAEFTRALSRDHKVLAAAPPVEAKAAAEQGAEAFPIDEPFPMLDTSRRLDADRRSALRREVALLREAVRATDADHALHLFADGVMRQLLVSRSVGAPLTVLLFRPRSHFPRPHQLRQPSGEKAKSVAYDTVVAAWRRRGDANAVLTLDPYAAARWARQRGAPVLFVPEPPVHAELPEPGARRGVALVGALSGRKGIEHVVAALERGARDVPFTIAGTVYEEYAATLSRHLDRLRAAGVKVHLRPGYQDTRTYLEALAQARAVLLPYVGHIGMSRVLLEAATVGTPVVAHEEGLLGHLVRSRQLGVTVDCRDSQAFAAAVREVVDEPQAIERYVSTLADFAEEHTTERFAAAARAPFDGVETNLPSN